MICTKEYLDDHYDSQYNIKDSQSERALIFRDTKTDKHTHTHIIIWILPALMYVTCEVWPNQSHQPTEDQMEDVDPQPKKRSEKMKC